MRDVTGKALFRSAVAWFCVEMESVVELLVPRYNIFTKSWICLASLSQPDVKAECMEVFLRLKDLHAYGKICESVHKTASANKICKRKRSFAKV